jgi:hypothetical protein
MKILLVGNFAPPYEEESLHNLSLFKRLTDGGHQCTVINISANPSIEEGFVDNISYAAFILKVMKHGFGKDAIHFLTKGYTRPGLMKMVTAVLLSRLMFTKSFITLHPELFSVFGQLRSKMGGQMLLHLSFSLSKRVICGDRHTFDVASIHYKSKNKFTLIPSFMLIPSDTNEKETAILKKLEGKKKVVVLSNIRYPSFVFDILDSLIDKKLLSDTCVVISFSEKFSSKLEHVIKEEGKEIADNFLFIDFNDHRMLSLSYSSADLIMRPLSCDGVTLFDCLAVSARIPLASKDQITFPTSLSFVKEGEMFDTISYIINDLLERDEDVQEPETEDLHQKIVDIYSDK